MRALSALSGLLTRGTYLENPSNPLSSSNISSALGTPGDLWGAGSSGNPLSVGTALRCVQILSSGVAGCPLRVMDRDTTEPVKVPALDSERAGTTPFERWETVVSHLALWGNAYIRKVRARDGRIVELIPIHPARVEVDVVDGTDVGMPFVKKFTVDGKVQLTEFEIMHVPGLSTDGVKGISVIGQLRATFALAESAERLATKMFDQGLLQTGFLSTEQSLDEEKSNILRARWRAKLSGIENAYEIGILDNGTKFNQLTMSPEDAQFLETRKFQTSEIARIFGLPGWLINDQEKSTSWGSGMEQQFIAFVVVSLKPYFHRIEQRVSREVCDPKTEKAEFKVEGLLRGDSKSRAAFYASGIQHGWMVPNEPRKLEDLPPVPWGDEPYRPYNEPASSQAGSDTSTGGDNVDNADA